MKKDLKRACRGILGAGWLIAAGCSVLPLAGCAKLHARNAPDAPPLDVPAPPPRVVEAPDTDVPPPVPLPEEPARHPNANQRRPAPPAPRPDPPKAEPPKTDQSGTSTTTAPPETVKPPEEPAHPPATLQTIPAGAEAEVERTIRSQLTRASSDLNRVDYRALNTDARTQYDSAKSYVRQAEDALRAKNLLFAQKVAEKAALIAAQLAGK